MVARSSFSKVPTRDLIGYFCSCYIRTVGEKYLISNGRDSKLFKALLAEYPAERIKQLMDIYFEKPEKIKSPVFFRSRINDLIQLDKIKNPVREKMQSSDAKRFHAPESIF